MKCLFGIFTALIVFFCPVRLWAVEYTGKDLRDPFSGEESGGLPAKNMNVGTSSQSPTLDLQGIFITSSGQRTAIINGTIVKVGSKIRSGEVKEISASGVSISEDGRDYFLPEKGRILYEKARIKRT